MAYLMSKIHAIKSNFFFHISETEGEKAKVLMHASFSDYETLPHELDLLANETEWDDIAKAINQSALFNVTFRTLISPDDTTQTCPTLEMFPVRKLSKFINNQWLQHEHKTKRNNCVFIQ